jgi:hypothetical protein
MHLTTHTATCRDASKYMRTSGYQSVKITGGIGRVKAGGGCAYCCLLPPAEVEHAIKGAAVTQPTPHAITELSNPRYTRT